MRSEHLNMMVWSYSNVMALEKGIGLKMNVHEMFIRTEEEFNKANEIICNVFNIKKNIPKQIFREEYVNFYCEEFDWALDQVEKDEVFWDILRKISAIAKDENIIMAVLAPHPKKYYYKNFGYYNWLKLPLDIEKEDYLEAVEMAPRGRNRGV